MIRSSAHFALLCQCFRPRSWWLCLKPLPPAKVRAQSRAPWLLSGSLIKLLEDSSELRFYWSMLTPKIRWEKCSTTAENGAENIKPSRTHVARLRARIKTGCVVPCQCLTSLSGETSAHSDDFSETTTSGMCVQRLSVSETFAAEVPEKLKIEPISRKETAQGPKRTIKHACVERRADGCRSAACWHFLFDTKHTKNAGVWRKMRAAVHSPLTSTHQHDHTPVENSPVVAVAAGWA